MFSEYRHVFKITFFSENKLRDIQSIKNLFKLSKKIGGYKMADEIDYIIIGDDMQIVEIELDQDEVV
jgi:hypothetical protein